MAGKLSRMQAMSLLGALAQALDIDLNEQVITKAGVEVGRAAGRKGAKRHTRVRQGALENKRLGFTVGDDCPWCDSPFKGTKTVEAKNGERVRATFKGCKHTVNVY